MTPDQLAKSGTEHGHQRALMAFCNMAARIGFVEAWKWADELPFQAIDVNAPLALPCLKWFHAIHNQGHGDMVRGAMAKAEGTKKGVADTFLPLPKGGFAGLYIEMKKPSERAKRAGNELKGASPEQLEFKEYSQAVGYGWALCYSWREAAQMLQGYIEQ